MSSKKSELSYEELSCLLDDLDVRLLSGKITTAEYREVVRSLGWDEDRIIDEINKRWWSPSLS